MAYQKKRKPLSTQAVDLPNWTQIIDHLRFREGYSMVQLANACHCARSRLYTIAAGTSQPEWLTGACLLQIYSEVT